VPLSQPVIEILETQKKLPKSEWVFPGRDATVPWARNAIHKRVRSLAARCGVDFRTHDLRRTATTLMAKARVPESALAKILNHRDGGVTAQHYNWYSYDAEKRAAMDTWARLVTAIVSATEDRAKVLAFHA
jgi:integrase